MLNIYSFTPVTKKNKAITFPDLFNFESKDRKRKPHFESKDGKRKPHLESKDGKRKAYFESKDSKRKPYLNQKIEKYILNPKIKDKR